MNRENIQWTIDLMKSVPPENFDITHWVDETLYREMYKTSGYTSLLNMGEVYAPEGGEPLHTCGNTACTYGWMAMEPYFRKWVWEHTDGGDAEYYHAAAFWGISHDTARNLILGFGSGRNYEEFPQKPMEKYVKAYWAEWKPQHVIRILENILENDGEFIP